MLKHIKKTLHTALFIIFIVLMHSSYAQNTTTNANVTSNNNTEDNFRIDINWQKNTSSIPIQVTGLNEKLLHVLNNNFERSGKLSIVTKDDRPKITDEKIIEAEYNLNNTLETKNGFYRVVSSLNKKNQKLATIQIDATDNIALAHRISDFVYETLFKKRGIFSTRLSYVVESKNYFLLMISDSDGSNAKVALQSKQPIISIAWSPSGKEVAYVSFENKKPVIYIHHLQSGQRRILANYSGNNSAPTWSPDGKQLALALSISGNTQIYKINADGTNLVRLTQSEDTIIDTEPQFSVDGQFIYFTSDRGGEAQIYKMSKDGEQVEKAKRVTFKGEENTSPRISPDGELLAYIGKNNGEYRVYIQNLNNGSAFSISTSAQDESPSFAANGDYIIYATSINGKNSLVAKSVEGGNAYVLTLPYAKVKQPTWGPFMQ